MSATKSDVISSFGWLEHQRILFLSAFIVGTIGVLSFRSLGFGILVTSAFTLTVMTLYMFSGVTKKFIIRPDVLGDNLYYLGFLFTLVSMAYSLYSLGVRKSDINAILENFGLAISTTLYGLALRVFFNQTKSDLEGYDTAVRMSLTDAASSLIGEMSSLGRDISTLRQTFTQTINETLEAQKNSLDQISKSNKVFINENMSAQRESITNLFDNLSKKQNEFLKEGLDRQAQELNKLNHFVLNKQIEMDRKFQTELENILEKITNSVSVVSDGAQQFSLEAKKFAPASAKVLKELDKFSSYSDLIQNNLITPLIDTTNAVSMASTQLNEITNSVKNINSHINGMSSEMPTVLEGMNSKYKVAINSQIQFYDSVKENLSNSINDLKLLGFEMKKATADQYSSQARITQSNIESNERYKTSIDNLVISFSDLNTKIDALSNGLTQIKSIVEDNLIHKA